MISKKMQTALNKQIKMEMDSAYLYMSMSNWFVEQNLLGFSSWMMNQYSEEMIHAMKMYKFLQDNGAKVVLDQVEKPKASWKGPQDVFEDTLAHEKKVTASIHNLYKQAKAEDDYATEVMLQWFITEQVEEEKTSTEIVDTLRMIGDSPSGIYMFDQELGRRGLAS